MRPGRGHVYHGLLFLLYHLILVASATCATSKDLEGIWLGAFETPLHRLELVWRVYEPQSDSLLVLHDSPAYGVLDVPVPVVQLNADSVLFQVTRFPATFRGRRCAPDRLCGQYQGEGNPVDFALTRITRNPDSLLAYMAPRLRADGSRELEWAYHRPQQSDDGWGVGDAASAGVDMDRLRELVQGVLTSHCPNLHSLLIARGDSLLVEEYFYGYNSDRPHPIYSNAKGVCAATLGLALAEGRVPALDTPLRECFPEYSRLLTDSLKSRITLRHTLSMQAGFAWDESSSSYYDMRNTNRQKMSSDDYVAFVLAQPMSHLPGTQYTYNSGLPDLWSELVRRGTGMSCWEVADQKIFSPLRMQHYLWETNSDGTAGGLLLRPRDFLKLARVYANHGQWHGKRVLAEGWLDECYRDPWDEERLPYWNHWGRGLQMVAGIPVVYYSGGGFGGQAIFAFPDLDLLVAFTAGNYVTPSILYDEVMAKYILPPLLEPESGYASPVRTPTLQLDTYVYHHSPNTGLACLWSAMSYLNGATSEAWVYGITGAAFALNANEYLWPNCVGRWDNPCLEEQLSRLGYARKNFYAYFLQPNAASVREEARQAVIQALEDGQPAWAFDLHLPESYLIYGYDQHGVYYRGVDCNTGYGPQSWSSLGTEDPGWFEAHTMYHMGHADTLAAVRASLRCAVRMWRQPQEFPHQGFVFGPEAYTMWQRALMSDNLDFMGLAYCASAWSTARRCAADYFAELEPHLPPLHLPALQRLQTHFRVVAESWQQVCALFPYEGQERWQLQENAADPLRREQAGDALREAALAEETAVQELELLLVRWPE